MTATAEKRVRQRQHNRRTAASENVRITIRHGRIGRLDIFSFFWYFLADYQSVVAVCKLSAGRPPRKTEIDRSLAKALARPPAHPDHSPPSSVRKCRRRVSQQTSEFSRWRQYFTVRPPRNVCDNTASTIRLYGDEYRASRTTRWYF